MFPITDVGQGPPCYGIGMGKICLTQNQKKNQKYDYFIML